MKPWFSTCAIGASLAVISLAGCDGGAKSSQEDLKAVRQMMEKEQQDKAAAIADDKARVQQLREKAASTAARFRSDSKAADK